MYDFPKPGPQQQRLSALAGEWESRVKFYFDPASPPMEKIGRHIAKVDLGGYFLDRRFEVALDDAGDFKQIDFQGRGLTGYDPFRGKYLGVWVDSGSPALYHTEGAFNEKGDVFTETSEGPDPLGNLLRLRMVTEITRDTELLFRMYRLDGDVEYLVTEMVHVRR